MLRSVKTLAARWQSRTPQQKRQIVNRLALHLFTAAGHQPRFEWRSAEALMRIQ
jgi:hypothetical protein